MITLPLLAVACGDTGKANKLIDEGNAAVQEGQKLAQEADAKNDQLIAALGNFPENRDELKGKAQEVMDLLDKSIARLREATQKFDDGSKTNIDAKLKEYLSLKSQEFSKHAEHLEVAKEIPKAVMDPAVTDTDTLKTRFTQATERVEKLQKEWEDLAARAGKIQEENKDKFKS
jgi:uncharacterized coiled-coil DUF342 family protein